MALDYTKKASRRGLLFTDLFHIAAALAILVLSVIFFTGTSKHRAFVPVIFFLTALMNGADAVYKIRHLPHGRKDLTGVTASAALTGVFLIICACSAIVVYL